MKLLPLVAISFVMALTLAACSDDSQSGGPGPADTVGADTPSSVDAGDDTALPGDTIEPPDDTIPGEDTFEDSVDPPDDSVEPPDDSVDPGDTVEPPPDQEYETIDCEADLGDTGGAICAATAGSDTVVYAGTVLAPYKVYLGGEVVVSPQGDILCVGCDCSDANGYGGATYVACPDGVISPGLINAHDHITFSQGWPVPHGDEKYEHRHDWRKGLEGHTKIQTHQNDDGEGTEWGELRQLISGTTSLNGSGAGDGLLRNLDKDYALLGLNQPAVEYQTFPLGDSGGTKLTETCDYDFKYTTDDISALAAWTPHISEGIDAAAHNEVTCTLDEEAGGEDLTQSNSGIIHGIGLNALEISMWSMGGTALIWSPRTNIDLYGNTAQATLYASLGAVIGLGTDWSYSGSMNMLRELNCADYLNTNYYDEYFSEYDLWRMATIDAAVTCRMDDAIGALEPTYVADIAIFDGSTNELFRAIIDGHPKDVALVVRGGTPLYGDAALMSVLGKGSCDDLDVCGASKKVCVESEVGMTLAELTNEVTQLKDGEEQDTYPLFFCGEIELEPSCHPARPGEYDGEASASDADGDGIVDAEDNCPSIFNPIREMDGTAQADFDGDGVGDVCDICPLDADTDECSTPDPDDIDGDGVANAQDNCKVIPNEDQSDLDGDGLGDVCDACPEADQSGNSGGAVSIAALNQICHEDHPPIGSTVEVEGRVTAVGSSGIWIQDPDLSAWAGVYVFLNGAPDAAVQEGVLVKATGEYDVYYELTEVAYATVQVLDATPQYIEPLELAIGEMNTAAGDAAEQYENMLVAVAYSGSDYPVVTSANPDGPGGDYNEMEISDSLMQNAIRIDDYIWDGYVAGREEGVTYSTVQGIAYWSFSNRKILPRSADDLVEVP